MTEPGDGIDRADHVREWHADRVQIPLDVRIPGIVLVVHQLQGLITCQITFPDLVASEGIMLRETCHRVVDVVVEGRSSVSDAPGRIGVRCTLPVVLIQERFIYLLFINR